MSGDALARGAKSAQFSAGSGDKDSPIELKNVAPEEPFSVTDKRPSYLDRLSEESAPIAPVTLKYPEKEYSPFKTILDRILVKRVSLDKNMEILSDGSLRDKRNGFVIPAKYRQHANVGVVVAAGDFVAVGNTKTPMEEVVRLGDRVMYGEYNAESFQVSKEEAQAFCDRIQENYSGGDDETFWIVRVQDVRGVQRPVDEEHHE
jgi:co-chaperonin GroES (HSP10)